jgi:2-dehydro-3-deoxyphosphooctonate aldolase (KDO 8-P synthase)
MKPLVEKIESTGNRKILLCERGTTFGYNMLVNDMRSLPLMRSIGYPVVFDAGHSTQLPGGMKNSSGGQSEFIPVLARAGVGAGCDALFVEVHEDPKNALCDGPSSLPLKELGPLLEQLRDIHEVVRS